MKYVELYRLQDDGLQRVVLRCMLNNQGKVICEGDPTLKASFETKGIEDFKTPGGVGLFPKDGIRFLEQLSYNFSSGYLNASQIKGE